jgi:hypothetical protein
VHMSGHTIVFLIQELREYIGRTCPGPDDDLKLATDYPRTSKIHRTYIT